MAAVQADDHRHLLRYIYRSEVPASERDAMRPTEGVVELKLVGRPVREISGDYFAERNAGRGAITFGSHSSRVAGSATEAAKLAYRSLG